MNYNFSCPSYGPLHQALSGKTRKGNISVNNKLQRKATVKMNFNWGQNAGTLDTIYKQETLFLLFLCYKTLSTFLLK
jgi:hypothetical protein